MDVGGCGCDVGGVGFGIVGVGGVGVGGVWAWEGGILILIEIVLKTQQVVLDLIANQIKPLYCTDT